MKLVIQTDEIQVYLADNGVGLCEADETSSFDGLHGFGLKGLKNRILALNGTMETVIDIETIEHMHTMHKHSGFCLKVTLPL